MKNNNIKTEDVQIGDHIRVTHKSGKYGRLRVGEILYHNVDVKRPYFEFNGTIISTYRPELERFYSCKMYESSKVHIYKKRSN